MDAETVLAGAEVCLPQKVGQCPPQDLWVRPVWKQGLCRCDHIKTRPPWVRVGFGANTGVLPRKGELATGILREGGHWKTRQD